MQCKAGLTWQNWCQMVEESSLSTRSWPTPLVSRLEGHSSPSIALQSPVQGLAYPCGNWVMSDVLQGRTFMST